MPSHNREGCISFFTHPVSWHRLRPTQWIKTSGKIKKRTSCPEHFRYGLINETKHRPSLLQVWNMPCCWYQADVVSMLSSIMIEQQSSFLLKWHQVMELMLDMHRWRKRAAPAASWLSALTCDIGMCCFICRRWDALTGRQMENRSCQLMELIKMKYHEPADTSRLDKHTITPCGNNYIIADSKSLCRWGVFVRVPLWWQGRGIPLNRRI